VEHLTSVKDLIVKLDKIEIEKNIRKLELSEKLMIYEEEIKVAKSELKAITLPAPSHPPLTSTSPSSSFITFNPKKINKSLNEISEFNKKAMTATSTERNVPLRYSISTKTCNKPKELHMSKKQDISFDLESTNPNGSYANNNKVDIMNLNKVVNNINIKLSCFFVV